MIFWLFLLLKVYLPLPLILISMFLWSTAELLPKRHHRLMVEWPPLERWAPPRWLVRRADALPCSSTGRIWWPRMRWVCCWRWNPSTLDADVCATTWRWHHHASETVRAACCVCIRVHCRAASCTRTRSSVSARNRYDWDPQRVALRCMPPRRSHRAAWSNTVPHMPLCGTFLYCCFARMG